MHTPYTETHRSLRHQTTRPHHRTERTQPTERNETNMSPITSPPAASQNSDDVVRPCAENPSQHEQLHVGQSRPAGLEPVLPITEGDLLVAYLAGLLLPLDIGWPTDLDRCAYADERRQRRLQGETDAHASPVGAHDHEDDERLLYRGRWAAPRLDLRATAPRDGRGRLSRIAGAQLVQQLLDRGWREHETIRRSTTQLPSVAGARLVAMTAGHPERLGVSSLVLIAPHASYGDDPALWVMPPASFLPSVTRLVGAKGWEVVPCSAARLAAVLATVTVDPGAAGADPDTADTADTIAAQLSAQETSR